MINSTRCAFMAKQACATFSKVVRKITPPHANNLLKFFFALFAILTLNAATAWAETTTLTNANIANLYNSSQTSWRSISNMTDINGFKYNAYAILNKHSNATSTYKFLQIKKYASNVAYYVQVPQMPGTITTISMTVSSSQKPMTDGGNTYTLYFSNSSKTSTTGNGVASGTGDKSVTIDCSTLNLKEGYITANGSVRIWDITVTYESATPPTPAKTYDVTWMVNGEEWDKTEGVEENTQITNLPTEPTDNCGNKVFQGWTDKPISGTTNTKPSVLFKDKSPEITEGLTTFYAVFATETNSGSGNLTTTFTPNVDDLSTGKNGITINMSNTAGASGYYQIFKSSSMTITSENAITSFTITCTASDKSKYGPGNITFTEGTYSYSGKTGIWIGNATSLTSSNAAEQLRINSIVVTTSSGSTTLSDYTTSCSQQPIQLAKPTGLTAKDITSNSATLSWTKVENKKEYKVTVTDDHDYTQTFTVSEETKTISDLNSNTTYYWTVQAMGDGTNYTDSEMSEQSSFNTLVPCTDAVTISKGTPSNGSFNLDKTGKQSTCNGAVTVTLSDIQPAAGYKFSAITQSGVAESEVKIDNTAQTVTYAQNATGESTINVTFTPIEYTFSLESTLNCVDNGSVTIEYNATSAKTFTAATRDDYTCTGYWSAPSGGVPVLKADGTFVEEDVNGFITDGKWINTTATKLTPRWETEYKMILSKGTEENGTYTLSPTNIETSGCAASTTRQVTITATPVAGYEVDQITYSGEGTATIKTGPTISDGKTTWVYTFDENDKGLGTFIVTFKQLPTYTVTWMANEQQHAAQTDVVGTPLTNPGDPEASTYACDDKVFVGWTAVKNYSNTTTPDDLFKSAEATSKTIPENGITYYAVFANATTTPGTTTTTEETATLSFENAAQRESISSTQQVWKQNGVVFTNNQANSDSPVADYVNPVRCYKNSDIILDCSELSNITKVLFKCTSSDYASDLASSIGSEASTSNTWVTLIPKTETKVYEISLSSGQTRISSVTVTYEKTIVNGPTVTYSNYSTTCAPAPKLVSITQTAGQTEFTEGDEFVKAIITATYEDESTKDVTSKATFSTPNMTQVGKQTISVSYKEGEITAETSYEINIKEKTKYTITWWANGEEFYTQKAVEGTVIEVPTTSPDAATYACDDKVFVGWVENEIDEATDEEPTFITYFDNITENKDYFAVFATVENNDESIFAIGKSGDFKIYAVVNGENKYATAYNNSKLGSTSEENSAVTYTFTHKGNNQYTIYNGSKYIAYGTSGTDLKTQSDEYLWHIAPATNGKGSWRVTSVSYGNRAIIYNTSNYFKAYATSNITTTGYYDIEIGSAPTTTYSGYVTTCEATTIQLGSGDNSTVITPNAGKTVNVQLNRSFTARVGYYTLCLPFNIAAEKIGTAYQLGEITEHVSGEKGGINIHLTEVEHIEAGKPYLVLPNTLTNPIFENVTIVNTEGSNYTVTGAGVIVTFTGIINGGGQTNGSTDYYVGEDGKLYKSTVDKLGLRAFFTITDETGNPTQIRARVVAGENVETGVEDIITTDAPVKVIENGQLIIIRDGVKYNVQGQRL